MKAFAVYDEEGLRCLQQYHNKKFCQRRWSFSVPRCLCPLIQSHQKRVKRRYSLMLRSRFHEHFSVMDIEDSPLCLQVSDSFPFKWINKKWKEGFYVTSMATSHTRWAVVMSRNAGFIDQCVELDFQYPSEGIHRRWDAGTDPEPFLNSTVPLNTRSSL